MRNTPPVDRKALTRAFLSRPLEAHITSAHDRLPEIIEAVVNMRAPRPKK